MVAISYGNVITEAQLGQDEVDYMTTLIKSMPSDGKMIEWGSGGSTCIWIDNMLPTQTLISVEHNESWHTRVKRAVKNHFTATPNVTLLHIPEEHGIQHGYGALIEELPAGVAKYINPDIGQWNANIYFIDGIARAACLMSVLRHNKNSDAAIFIHDYKGREPWYDWASQFCRVEIVGTTLARLYPNPVQYINTTHNL